MKRSLLLNRVCAVTAITSLGLAYILAGNWLILLAFLGMFIFWILLKKSSVFRVSSALLSIFVLLAAIGITASLSTPLIVVACTAALASWDLTNFTDSQNGNPHHETSLRLERFHLGALAQATFIGFALAMLGAYVNFQLPFGVTLLLVLIAIGCLTYAVQSLTKKLG